MATSTPTTSTALTADQPTTAGPPNGDPSVAVRPIRLRRRGLALVGIIVIALSGAAAAWLYNEATDTHGVLAVTQPLQRGTTITADSLTVAQITLDPALSPIPAADLDSVVGLRAASDLPAGTILTRPSLTEALPPGDGHELVGLAVTAAQLPAEPLLSGDVVRIVDTPREQDDPPTESPRSTLATVITVRSIDETGRMVVDVVVPDGQGPSVAARAATGRIALVLQNRHQD